MQLATIIAREPFAAHRSREVIVLDLLVGHVSPSVETLVPYGNIAIDGTEIDRRLLERMVDAEDARRGHRYPVMTSPSLHHQQKVQMATVHLVVRFEVIVGLLHEAANLAAQQHLGQDVAAVVEVLGCGSVPDGKGDGGTCCLRVLHREMYGVERLVAGLYAGEVHIRTLDVLLVTDKAEPVAIDTSISIVHRYLSHACWKRICRDAYLCVLGTELLEVMQGTSHHDGHAQSLAGCLASWL